MNNQKKLGVGAIIQNQSGDFLLHLRDGHTRNMPNQWCLIGGRVEPDETPEGATVREIEEEIGLLSKQISPYTTINFDKNWNVIIFDVQVDSNKQQIVLHEGKKLKFFTKKELITFIKTLPYSNPFLDVLMQYLEN